MKHRYFVTLACSIALSGLAGFTQPALADVAYSDLLIENGGDLDRSHWASSAIQELVDKYGVVAGFPDRKFRGTRTLTRFEQAAALYRVMQYVDKVVADNQRARYGGDEYPLTKNDISDFKALLSEFKDELDIFKANQLDLRQRIEQLENIQVHGQVDVRYRDRLAVTDGTDLNSPLFANGNTSATRSVGSDGSVSDRSNLDFNNNRGQFSHDANGQPTRFNSPADAALTPDDLAPYRVHSRFDLSARLTENMTLATGFDLFELGAAANGTPVSNGGHNLNEGHASGSPFVFREALIQFGKIGLAAPAMPSPGQRHSLATLHKGTPEDLGIGASLKVGLMNFAQDLNPNTHFSNAFDQSTWTGHGYGLVGWGGSETPIAKQEVNGYLNSLSRYWAGGLGASMVDPDSQSYNQVTSPAVSFTSAWGWGRFFVGANFGSIQTQRAQAATGNLSSGTPPVLGDNAAFSTSADNPLFRGAVLQGLDRKGRLTGNQLALPSQYGDGYSVIGFDARFLQEVFPIRVGLHAMNYLNDSLFNFSGPSRKEISGIIDLGWNRNFGLTIGLNKSFIGYDRHAIGLLFNDILGSGYDLQFGTHLATRNGLFNLADLAYGNLGMSVGIPLLNFGSGKDQLKLLLAARQAFGDNFGAALEAGAPNQAMKDSGITVSLPYLNVAGSPVSIRAEYSLLLADALWSFRPVAHDLSIVTSYVF